MMKTSHQRIADALELYLRELPAASGATVLLAGTMETAPRERVVRFCAENGVALRSNACPEEAANRGESGFAAVVLLGLASREEPARWQPLLRKEGVLLLEVTGGGTVRRWRAALGQGGFFRIQDRGGKGRSLPPGSPR